jgi:hypothetical protein
VTELFPVYYRTGRRIHMGECRYARHGGLWRWADGLDATGIARALVDYPWLVACQVCRPDRPAPR